MTENWPSCLLNKRVKDFQSEPLSEPGHLYLLLAFKSPDHCGDECPVLSKLNLHVLIFRSDVGELRLSLSAFQEAGSSQVTKALHGGYIAILRVMSICHDLQR